jgi:hypothetical protein
MQNNVSISFNVRPRVEGGRIVSSNISVNGGPTPSPSTMGVIYSAASLQLQARPSSFLVTGESLTYTALREMKDKAIVTNEEEDICFDDLVLDMMTKRIEHLTCMTLRCWSICDQLDLDIICSLFEKKIDKMAKLVSGPTLAIRWESVEHMQHLMTNENGCSLNLDAFLRGDWHVALLSFLYFCSRSRQFHYKQVVKSQNNLTDTWQRVSLGPTLSTLLKAEMLERIHTKDATDAKRVDFEKKIEQALISGLEKAEECALKNMDSKNGMKTFRCKIARVIILFERCLNFKYNLNLHTVIRRRLNKLIPQLKFI